MDMGGKFHIHGNPENNASIILRFAFCCCVSVKSADIIYEVANDKIGRVSWFNHFIGRFCRASKPRPQKLANFIDGLTSP